MYGRPIHIYCYSQEPINIFQHMQNRPGVESELNIPIRLAYIASCLVSIWEGSSLWILDLSHL